MGNWAKIADTVIKAGIKTFGTTVEYYPQNEEPVEIEAIFDEAHVTSDPGSEIPIDTVNPIIHVRLLDLPCSPSPGDRVCIGEKHFRVMSFQPDGQGAAVIILHKI